MAVLYLLDAVVILAVQFQFGASGGDADLNGDGLVDDADLMIVLFSFGQSADASWGNFPAPSGWYTLQFAVQLGDYVGVPSGTAQINLRDRITGAQYTTSIAFNDAPLQVVSIPVPTPNPYAVQVVAPAGGSWLTISRTDVQATAPAPDTTGRALRLSYYGQDAPPAWRGKLAAVRVEGAPNVPEQVWRFEYLPTLNEMGGNTPRLARVIFPLALVQRNHRPDPVCLSAQLHELWQRVCAALCTHPD
jgi:hypothetical protein